MTTTSESQKKRSVPLLSGTNHEATGDLLQKAFDHSLQANIISIIKDGTIIRANRAACKLLGYSKKELLTKKRADIFLISESNYKTMLRDRKADGFAKADLSILRKNGKSWPCEISSVIFKDDNGVSNSITTIVDGRERISRQKRIDLDNERATAINVGIAESKSNDSQAQNRDWIKAIGKNSYDVTWDWDIVNNSICFGRSYEKVFGYRLPKNKISFQEWIAFFVPVEGRSLEKNMKDICKSDKKNWRDTYKFTCPDGSLGHVIMRANIGRDNTGSANRMIGVIHDISKVLKLEEILEQELVEKKKQLLVAFAEGKEMERSDIGKELHDNINQLLGASMLYLDMARKDINNGEMYLIHSSEYTMTAIEEIRKLTQELTNKPMNEFGLCGAIEQVCQDTMDTYPIQIHCTLDDSLEQIMCEKFQLNTFRIFQEQLNNILKHAHASDIHISLSQEEKRIVFSIIDNGIGFDKSKPAKGIGISNVISRAESYTGKADFIAEPGKGCQLMVSFPAENAI